MTDTITGTDHQYNYLSCSNGQWGLYAGSDHAQPLEARPNPMDLMPRAPGQYDAILKLADGTNSMSFSGLAIAQGHEDSINIANHANRLQIDGNFGIGSDGAGQRVITIKGGVSLVVLSGVICSRGSLCEVKIGDWMDQTYEPCRGLVLRLGHVDGPVRVIKNFRDQADLGPECKLMFWASLALTAYWYFKYAVRKLYRIPVGTPGPKWLA